MPVKQRGHKYLVEDASTVVLCRVYIRRTTEIKWEKHLYRSKQPQMNQNKTKEVEPNSLWIFLPWENHLSNILQMVLVSFHFLPKYRNKNR